MEEKAITGSIEFNFNFYVTFLIFSELYIDTKKEAYKALGFRR
jgi:hypothetical protein